VIERTLSFEVQPLLPFLLPGHALVAIFSSATTWSRSGCHFFFCYYLVTLWPVLFLTLNRWVTKDSVCFVSR